MRRRFFWALVAVALVTLAVGGIAAAVLINRSVERSVRDEFNRQAEATAGLIENTLNQPVPGQPGNQSGGLASAARTLGSLLAAVEAVGGHDYVEAALVTPEDTVVVVGEHSVLIEHIPGGVTGVTRRVQFEADVDGESVAAFALPVRTRQIGTMVVVIGSDLELVPWRDVVLRFVWAIALGLLLAALLAGWLARFLSRRLEGLRTASRSLAGGDLAARAPEEGNDEVTEVSVAFNEMATQLEAARRREREFLVSVGHDLRTPLTTVTGYTEALEEGRVTADDLPRVASVIHRESNRLGRLVEDLMLLSRLEAREFSLRPEPVDLVGHLRGTLDAYRGRAGEAGVELIDALPALPEVVTDPDRIDQVVGNLVENALRYTPEGGRVTLALEPADGYVRIVVADTGPGIEAADVPHIFERLYVSQRYRPLRPEGSGLGLTIVKELVEAMGGRAEVVSEPGRGTTVSVLIPVAPPPS